jgi:hypothetical protein
MADKNPNTHTEKTARTKECKIMGPAPVLAMLSAEQISKVRTLLLCTASNCFHWKWAPGQDPVKSKEFIQSESKRTDQNVKNTEALKESDVVKSAAIDKIKEDFLKFKENNQPEGYCGLTK